MGTIVRFDSVKGYGFIEPDEPGEDLFVHVNDLDVDKHLLRAGVRVEFTQEMGDRGLKASQVRLAASQGSSRGRQTAQHLTGGDLADTDDVLCDVLTPSEFRREVTELLLRVEPALTSPQIIAVRERLATLATSFHWVENA